MSGQKNKKTKKRLVNLIKHKEWNCIYTLWYGPVICVAYNELIIQNALLCEWCDVVLEKVAVVLWRMKQVKSPVHLCSLKNCSLVLVFRTVLVFISWRSVDHCECWTCAWFLSHFFVVWIQLMNALQNHSAPCLQSEHTLLNQWWISFTVYNNASWHQNVPDIFDIL